MKLPEFELGQQVGIYDRNGKGLYTVSKITKTQVTFSNRNGDRRFMIASGNEVGNGNDTWRNNRVSFEMNAERAIITIRRGINRKAAIKLIQDVTKTHCYMDWSGLREEVIIERIGNIEDVLIKAKKLITEV